MPWPDEPCPSCPRVAAGLPPPCLAMTTRHGPLCARAAEGHEGYTALLLGRAPPAEIVAAPAAGPPPPPSLPAMARAIAAALARWTAAGCPEVDDAEQARRLAICRAPCSAYYDPSRDACLKCGCGTVPVAVALGFDLAKKARWATEHCPIGMW